MEKPDYPESTDPRVFEAIVSYLKQYHDRIVIVESSGKPMPTRTSFKVAGYDRIAKKYHTGLIALETCSVVRYLLPKAEVMKEVYIRRFFRKWWKEGFLYIGSQAENQSIYPGDTGL